MKAFFAAIIVCLSFTSCEYAQGDFNTVSECGESVQVSESLFKTAPNDFLTINQLEITEDCLIINFTSSGCSGDSWEVKLIDAGLVMESYPAQRSLRLSLNNEELCEAEFTKEISFDISNLQVEGNKVWLNIAKTDGILYEY